MPDLSLLTNHAHVLLLLSRDDDIRMREIGDRVGITERAVARIVRELVDHGMLEVFKEGRCNRYRVHPECALPHPIEHGATVGDLIRLVSRPRRGLAELATVSMADRPVAEVSAFIRSVWPAFVWDARGPGPDLDTLIARWGAHGWLLLDGDTIVAAANSVPLTVPDRLPDEGWDWAVRAADSEGRDRCALMVTVAPSHQRRGLSKHLLRTMVEATEGRLIIPVRPPSKPSDQPIEALLSDPERDPWLRTHLAVGAWIVGPCHHSMVLEAPWDAWERWGEQGRIAPVTRQGDQGRYVEANVWVEHPT